MGCRLSADSAKQEQHNDTKSDPTKPDSKTVVIFIENIQDLQKQSSANGDLDVFTYEELRLATSNFRANNVVGSGGFGVVYRGILDENVRPGYNTTHVAVKVLDPQSLQGDREWLAEVNYQGQFRHPNLVKLIGYCCQDDHRLLVYEYMASGSLDKHLFKRVENSLTWQKRLKIASDIAKGLAFLHGLEKPIIYRDFKSSNILLDEEFNAKLSDFGLARFGPTGDQTHVSTRVMGTYGYAAPEYIMTGHLTARSDVYGFGVVLLEMLIGRRAMDKSRPSMEHNLVDWARPVLTHNKRLLRILDPRVEGQYSLDNLMKVANLAYFCLSQSPKVRPEMSRVIESLEPIVAQEMSLKEAIMWSGGHGSVTLFEVPRNQYEYGEETKRKQLRIESERIDVPEKNQTRGRSKSELPNQCKLYDS